MEHENPNLPDSLERDPERAEEQAYAEKAERDILREYEQEFKSQPGIGDDPSARLNFEWRKNFLSATAEMKSDEMRQRQQMREVLDRGEMESELNRLQGERREIGDQLAQIDPLDYADHPDKYEQVLKRNLEVMGKLSIGERLLELKVLVENIRARGELETFIIQAREDLAFWRDMYEKNVQLYTLAMPEQQSQSMPMLKDRIEQYEEALRIAEQAAADQLG